MKKNILITTLILSNLIINTCFAQKKDTLSLYQNAQKLFKNGKYSELLHSDKNKQLGADSLQFYKLIEQAKRSIYLTKKVKYHLNKRNMEITQQYIDSLKNINQENPKIAYFYLALGDLMLKKGNIVAARFFFNQSKIYSGNINLKSRIAYIELLQERAKYVFVKKKVDFLWLDDYATLKKKKNVKKLESKRIDSLYNIQRDSLNYKKWLPMIYVLGGLNQDKFLINSSDGKKYLTVSNASPILGFRLFLSPPMKKTSYFVDILYSNHNFQNIELIENTKYYIEKFNYSTISLPINIKYNLTNSAKHFYATAGISTMYKFKEKYEHSFRAIQLNDKGIFHNFHFALVSGLGYHIESKKNRQSMFFETKFSFSPLNVIKSQTNYNEFDRQNELKSQVLSGYFTLGIKF